MGRSQIYQFYFLCEIAHNYALTDRNIREVLNIWKKMHGSNLLLTNNYVEVFFIVNFILIYSRTLIFLFEDLARLFSVCHVVNF